MGEDDVFETRGGVGRGWPDDAKVEGGDGSVGVLDGHRLHFLASQQASLTTDMAVVATRVLTRTTVGGDDRARRRIDLKVVRKERKRKRKKTDGRRRVGGLPRDRRRR